MLRILHCLASLTPKFNHRYYGPYKVLKSYNGVTYKLDLPQHMHIHNTFHVSLLKRFVQDKRFGRDMPLNRDTQANPCDAEVILKHKLGKKGPILGGRSCHVRSGKTDFAGVLAAHSGSALYLLHSLMWASSSLKWGCMLRAFYPGMLVTRYVPKRLAGMHSVHMYIEHVRCESIYESHMRGLLGVGAFTSPTCINKIVSIQEGMRADVEWIRVTVICA